MFPSAHLTRKQGVLFKLRQVNSYLLTTLLWSRLQQNGLRIQFAITVTANLTQHCYTVLQVKKKTSTQQAGNI